MAVGGTSVVLIFRNTVLAQIGRSNTIKAAGMELKADSVRNITSYVVAGSAGGTAVAGSVLVLMVGSKPDSDTNTALGTTKDTVQKSISNSDRKGALDNANKVLGSNSNLSIDIGGYFAPADAALANTTSTVIGVGTTITLTGNAVIWAKEATTLTAVTGTGSGALVAAGGSVAIAILNGTTQVIINGSVSANGTVTVQAENTINGTRFYAKSGSAGVIGLGAAVAYMDVTGTTQILIGSTGSLSGKSGVKWKCSLNYQRQPGGRRLWRRLGICRNGSFQTESNR